MKKLFIAVSAMLVCAHSGAQTISYVTNAPRSGDKYQIEQLLYFSPGNEGKDVVWDFSELSSQNTLTEREFFVGQDSLLIGVNQDQLSMYDLRGDSLLCMGYETRLSSMSFSEPMVMMTYPFTYGYSISNSYKGLGDYCKRLILKNGGTLMAEADAEGSIITGEGDTLRNVLRIHTTRLNSVSLHQLTDTLCSDTSRMKQEIEESYQWYVKGYRYPMYETMSVSYYDNMTPVSCIQKAYRYLPDGLILENDSVNEDILIAEQNRNEMLKDVIDYEIIRDASGLTIRYSLNSEANVNALICNSRGVLYGRKNVHQPEGAGYEMAFDISLLPKGEYVIYINVNGKVYNEKFNVK